MSGLHNIHIETKCTTPLQFLLMFYYHAWTGLRSYKKRVCFDTLSKVRPNTCTGFVIKCISVILISRQYTWPLGLTDTWRHTIRKLYPNFLLNIGKLLWLLIVHSSFTVFLPSYICSTYDKLFLCCFFCFKDHSCTVMLSHVLIFIGWSIYTQNYSNLRRISARPTFLRHFILFRTSSVKYSVLSSNPAFFFPP